MPCNASLNTERSRSGRSPARWPATARSVRHDGPPGDANNCSKTARPPSSPTLSTSSSASQIRSSSPTTNSKVGIQSNVAGLDPATALWLLRVLWLARSHWRWLGWPSPASPDRRSVLGRQGFKPLGAIHADAQRVQPVATLPTPEHAVVHVAHHVRQLGQADGTHDADLRSRRRRFSVAGPQHPHAAGAIIGGSSDTRAGLGELCQEGPLAAGTSGEAPYVDARRDVAGDRGAATRGTRRSWRCTWGRAGG